MGSYLLISPLITTHKHPSEALQARGQPIPAAICSSGSGTKKMHFLGVAGFGDRAFGVYRASNKASRVLLGLWNISFRSIFSPCFCQSVEALYGLRLWSSHPPRKL